MTSVWKWTRFPNGAVRGMDLYGVIQLPWQYVISYDHEFSCWGASVKMLSELWNKDDITSLGHNFPTLEEAEGACLLHYQSNKLKVPAIEDHKDDSNGI
jgi:hypothetical protein